MQRKVKIGIIVALAVVMVASVAYAWIASNVLYFQTNLAGDPFTLAVVTSYSTLTPASLPYLPTTMHYNEPITLETTTTNLANSAYSGVTTNYEIWESGAPTLPPGATGWITVAVQNVNSTSPYNAIGSPITLSFNLYTDASLSGNSNNALIAYIGPYTAPAAPWSAYANVTVTFTPSAALNTYGANVWVNAP